MRSRADQGVYSHRYQRLTRHQEGFQNISGGISGHFNLITASLNSLQQ